MMSTMSGVAKNGRDASWSERAREAKADYVYMRALEYMVNDSISNSQAMVDYAYTLTPEDRYLASLDASMTIKLCAVNSPQFAERYRRLYDNYMLNPSDRYLGEEIYDISAKLRKYQDATRILECLDSVYNTEVSYALQLATAYMIDGYMGDSTAVGKAIKIYDRLERGMGKSLGLSSYRVRGLDLVNDTASINKELQSLITEFPDDPSVFHYAGTIYEKLGKDTIAEQCYMRAGKVDPDYDIAAADLANLYLGRCDTVSFKANALLALKSPNVDPESKYTLMRDFLCTFTGDSASVAEAEVEIGPILEANPGDGLLHGLVGTFYGINKNVERAVEELSYAVALDPTNDQVWALYVAYLEHLDRQKEALEAVKKMAELFPKNVNYVLIVSGKMAGMGQKKEALDYLLSIDASRYPNKESQSLLIATIGDTYQMLDSIDSAQDCYERAITIDPNNYIAYNNCAYMIADRGRDLDKARRYATYAVMSSPHSSTYLDTYAWVLFKLKDYAGARTNIDQALTDEIAMIRQAQVDSTSVDSEAYTPDIENIVDVDSNEDEASMTLVDRCVKYKEQIGPELLEHAGDIYFMNGEPAEAFKFWKAALDVAPADRNTAVLKKKVKNKTFFYE